MPSIVQLFVSETLAPAPSTLQATGALISQGATTLSTGGYALLTQPADLTPLLAPALALSTLAWSGGTVTATTAATIPGLTTGDVFLVTIAGTTPAGYSGTYLATVSGASTFTYALSVNPGAESVPGTYTPPSQVQLQAMVQTFFAQGSAQSVYVLELGPGDKTTGPGELATWITTNPGIFYSYLLPRGWDATSGLLSLIASYENLTAKTYFFVTTTTSNYTTYTSSMKCVVALIEAPARPNTEFSLAAAFQHSLAYNPGPANKMTPFAYSFLFGVTAYPTQGNGTLLTALKAAHINVIGTGVEGGLPGSFILDWGTTADGMDFSWWYAVDWVQIQSQLRLANAVINGSNNTQNPLYYNQNGINTLQTVELGVMTDGVSFGLLNGAVNSAQLTGTAFAQAIDAGTYDDQNVVNAVPFIPYTQENPSAYAEGAYGGLSALIIPQRGFLTIQFYIQVTDLISL
jgi:hypothetical protein